MAGEKQGIEGSAFEQLRDMLTGVIGADAVEILDIQPGSKFVADLGMDSIQIVALIEQGNTQYEGKVNFVAWLTTMEYTALLELTVGDVADFIEQSLRQNTEKAESKR
jgi:acyl carrier protein